MTGSKATPFPYRVEVAWSDDFKQYKAIVPAFDHPMAYALSLSIGQAVLTVEQNVRKLMADLGKRAPAPDKHLLGRPLARTLADDLSARIY